MIQETEILSRSHIQGTNPLPERVLQTVRTNEDDITKVPGFLLQELYGQIDTSFRHTQRRINEQFQCLRFWLIPDIAIVQVDLVTGCEAIEFFLESCRIGKIRIATGGHIPADHNPVDGLRWVRHRHIDDQNLFAIFAQNVPDCLPSLALRLHTSLPRAAPFLPLIICPEVIDPMTSRL